MKRLVAFASRLSTGGLGFWAMGDVLGDFYKGKAARARL
jgi:hypothetical protein